MHLHEERRRLPQNAAARTESAARSIETSPRALDYALQKTFATFRRPSRPSEDLRDLQKTFATCQKVVATFRTPLLTPKTPPHAPNAVACIGSYRVRREPRQKRRGHRLKFEGSKIAGFKH